MQKHFHYTWQEWVSEETRKAQEATITIASAVPKIEVESWKRSDCENHTGTQNCRRGVLGLAPCHDDRSQMDKPLQVRQRDVSLWYHCDFWPSSLAQEPESHLCPLHCFVNVKIPNKIEITKSRSFTSFQMVHTHTHFIYMYSNIIYPEAQTITSLCASIRFLGLSRMFSCHHQSPSCNGSLD